MAFKAHHTCSRLWSPSQFIVKNNTNVHIYDIHQGAAVLAVPANRGRQQQQRSYIKETSSFQATECRGSSTEILSSQNSKTESKDLKGRNKPSYIDISSVLQTVGALNIELQKVLNLKEKLFKRIKIDDSSSVIDNESELKTPITGVENKLHNEINKGVPPTSPDKSISLNEREEHDFIQAMIEQDTSIRNYQDHKSEHLLHINQNISGSSTSQKSGSKDVSQPQQSTSTAPPNPSGYSLQGTTNLVKQLVSYIPGFSQSYNQVPKDAPKLAAKKKIQKDNTVPRSVVDRKTRGLVKGLRVATSSASKLVRLEDLCRHLAAHPEAKTVAVKEKLIQCLLSMRDSKDVALRERVLEGLSLVGFTDPVRGRGIRILTIDGGGTRGLVAIEILRQLEESCQTRIHKLFDYICGVSTGSLIAIMLGIHKLTLDQAEHLYKTFSTEVFSRYKLMGVSQLVMSQGYYNAQLWEKILQENVGSKTFLESAREIDTPKVAAVSTLMNMTKLSNYLFRNYHYPCGAHSQYPGNSKYKLWEAVRASSAAPAYYEEYKLDEWIHQDGGIIQNNPTAIAIHEAKLLWPHSPLQCVVSIGNGRYEPSAEPELTTTGLRNKVTKIIQSATDTEAVHTVLNDLLPPPTYFRFNPYMSEEFYLDEIRPDRWDQMTLDTQLYCRKNKLKIQKATTQLMTSKSTLQKITDWVQLKKAEVGF